MNGVRVGCFCGWRGRRVWQQCGCYEMCSHTGFGYCPKCKGTVYRMDTIRNFKQQEKAAKAESQR